MYQLCKLAAALYGMVGTFQSLAASDLDAIGAMLEASGFAHCDNMARLKSCAVGGSLPDGKPFVVSILIAELAGSNNIMISVQPAAAIDTEPVRVLYEQIAPHLPYDKGTLKDRFPDMEAARLWCQEAPAAIHTVGRCKVTEKIGENQKTELNIGSPLDIDHWALSWSVPDTN
jgi:hypothetical protein